MKTRTTIVIITLLSALTLFSTRVYALEATFDLSGGYNDNVVEEDTASGSAFSNYRLAVDQTLYATANRALTGYFTGNYRDHFRLGDQWQATLGISTWQRLLDGKIHAKTFAELSRYRDAVIRVNEHDQWLIGTHWQWFINERLSAGGKVSYTASDYRPLGSASSAETTLTTGKKKQNSQSNAYQGHNNPPLGDDSQRDDRLWQFAAIVDYLFSADLSTELVLSYADTNSNYRYEDCREKGLETRWFYHLSTDWNLEIWGVHLWQNYPRKLERQWITGSRCDWQLDQHKTIYLNWEKRWHDAPYAKDNYTEMITQCGLTWSF
jgi:hypothetical protein